jgi:hypothetical protein
MMQLRETTPTEINQRRLKVTPRDPCKRELGLAIYLNPLGDTDIAVANADNICKRGNCSRSQGLTERTDVSTP